MRKTARTVVWEGAGAQSPAPDPIARSDARLADSHRGRDQGTITAYSPDYHQHKDYSPEYLNLARLREQAIVRK